jgi:hypothetical protein
MMPIGLSCLCSSHINASKLPMQVMHQQGQQRRGLPRAEVVKRRRKAMSCSHRFFLGREGCRVTRSLVRTPIASSTNLFLAR